MKGDCIGIVRRVFSISAVLTIWFINFYSVGCSEPARVDSTRQEENEESDADANSESDADSDTDGDSDSDADGDSQSDSVSDDDEDSESNVETGEDLNDEEIGHDTGDEENSDTNKDTGNINSDTDEDEEPDRDTGDDDNDDTSAERDPPDTGADTGQNSEIDTGSDDDNGPGVDTDYDSEMETGEDWDSEEDVSTEEDADSEGDTGLEDESDVADYGISDPDAMYPFPQNVKYPYGIQSSSITNQHVADFYLAWRAHYLQECNGNLRPGVDPLSKSLVEAQGFAMVAAAYMGDREIFDQLYNYYVAKCTNAGCGLMGWKNNCDGWEDQGAATDGDIDVASGLVVAHWQWPDAGYDEKANSVISNLKRMILDCGGTSTLYPGCSGGRPWGGCNETDISYYSPAFFRYFAEISGDQAWSKLADDTHKIRDAAAHPSTGLVPDWQSTSGTAGAGSRKGYYSFDAIRVPYKHALDYIWNGNEQAGAWCEKITTWAYGVGVSTIRDGYNLDGSVVGSSHNLATVGSLAVAAMANTQEVVDAFVEESVKLPDDYWYSGYLGNLYLLAMSGNMWNPDLVSKK